MTTPTPQTAAFTTINTADHTFTHAEALQIPRVDFADLTPSARAIDGDDLLVFGADKHGNLAVAAVSTSPGSAVVHVEGEGTAHVCTLYASPLGDGSVVLAEGNQRFELGADNVKLCDVPNHQPDYTGSASSAACRTDLDGVRDAVTDALAAAESEHESLLASLEALPPVIFSENG